MSDFQTEIFPILTSHPLLAHFDPNFADRAKIREIKFCEKKFLLLKCLPLRYVSINVLCMYVLVVCEVSM